MRAFFNHLRQRWNDWCGDREMEQAIRAQLDRAGFFGRSARLSNVRLVAVQRPGWVQVYGFDCAARRNAGEAETGTSDAAESMLYGLVRDDARRGTEVQMFADRGERNVLFAEWSDGLITLRGVRDI